MPQLSSQPLERRTVNYRGQHLEVLGWDIGNGQTGWNWRDQSPETLAVAERIRQATQPKPPPERPPVALIPPPNQTDFRLNGVDWSKVTDKPETYIAHGRAANRFVAEVKAGKSGNFSDDSDKPHISIIGQKEETTPVLNAFAPSGPLADIATHFHVRAFTPNDKYVADIGLPNGGKPDIVVQEPAGRVILRQRDFAGGATALRENLERAGALRRPNPNYNPSNDPTPASTNPTPNWLYIALVAFAAILLLDRGKHVGISPRPHA